MRQLCIKATSGPAVDADKCRCTAVGRCRKHGRSPPKPTRPQTTAWQNDKYDNRTFKVSKRNKTKQRTNRARGQKVKKLPQDSQPGLKKQSQCTAIDTVVSIPRAPIPKSSFIHSSAIESMLRIILLFPFSCCLFSPSTTNPWSRRSALSRSATNCSSCLFGEMTVRYSQPDAAPALSFSPLDPHHSFPDGVQGEKGKRQPKQPRKEKKRKRRSKIGKEKAISSCTIGCKNAH